jgi:sucrose phosphorylase
LVVLREFLLASNLQDLINTVHILPFFPYSSDDGFSVIDYRQIDPALGDWNDVAQLNEHFGLMFDLVLNHVSSQSTWFADYLRGQPPYDKYFIECDPAEDLSAVTRPRSLPLLTEVETSAGGRYVWTTFSADQVDLNFAQPDVLVEMLDILLEYANRGARIIRLDAIAYLWKSIGTNCIHLEETHEVVKLMRDVLEAAAPGVLILTETNVPHAENVSYFGDGDEAHLVYQFSLPPLLLDAFVHRDGEPIKNWLAELEAPRPGTNYFNFTASHDGVGVRPLEGLVSEERLASLVRHVHERGGRVSTRSNPDGSHTPYELNISYVDALGDDNDEDPQRHAQRFLASQALMLGLQGIPGIYFHSLLGSQNDQEGVRQSDQPRRINRHKYELRDLQLRLNDSLLQKQIFAGYQQLLRQRIEQSAFHPDANQQYLPTQSAQLLALTRTSDEGQTVLVATNFGDAEQSLDVSIPGMESGELRDLISGQTFDAAAPTIPPCSTVWLVRV